MSSLKRKAGRGLLYGENTVQVNIRVPESKKDEILEKFYLILNEYIASYSSNIEVVDATIEKPVLKKSNPTDDSFKASGILIDEAAVFPKFATKMKSEKDYFVKNVIVPSKKEVDIDSLQSLANGVKPFKCGCWIDEKNQLRRPKGSVCNLFKSEHKK